MWRSDGRRRMAQRCARCGDNRAALNGVLDELLKMASASSVRRRCAATARGAAARSGRAARTGLARAVVDTRRSPARSARAVRAPRRRYRDGPRLLLAEAGLCHWSASPRRHLRRRAPQARTVRITRPSPASTWPAAFEGFKPGHDGVGHQARSPRRGLARFLLGDGALLNGGAHREACQAAADDDDAEGQDGEGPADGGWFHGRAGYSTGESGREVTVTES